MNDVRPTDVDDRYLWLEDVQGEDALVGLVQLIRVQRDESFLLVQEAQYGGGVLVGGQQGLGRRGAGGYGVRGGPARKGAGEGRFGGRGSVVGGRGVEGP